MTSIEFQIECLNEDIQSENKLLAKMMKDLGERLLRKAERMSNDPTETPNGCGEIQGRGSDIDIVCGRLVYMREMLRKLNAAFLHDSERKVK